MLAAGSQFLTVPVAGPFDMPWSVAFLPDGAFLVTERPRTASTGQTRRPNPVPYRGDPVVLTVGQGGLLDVAVDLDFATNNIVYLSYLSGSEDVLYDPRAKRPSWTSSSETLTEQKVIFESSPRRKA